MPLLLAYVYYPKAYKLAYINDRRNKEIIGEHKFFFRIQRHPKSVNLTIEHKNLLDILYWHSKVKLRGKRDI